MGVKNMGSFNRVIIFLFIIFFVTGCSNPFQKQAIIVGKEKIEGKGITNTNINEEVQQIKENTYNEYETDNNNINEIINNDNFHSDEEIVTYFEDINNETTALLSNDETSYKEKIINSFVDVIDFIFYDKEIKGVKFKSLRNETKEKILEMASKMDNSIEKRFPNYKDKIKATSTKTYNKISDKLSLAKSYIKEKTKNTITEDSYNNFEENYNSLKESVKNTGEKIKDGISNTKNKIKEWYEEKTNKN